VLAGQLVHQMFERIGVFPSVDLPTRRWLYAGQRVGDHRTVVAEMGPFRGSCRRHLPRSFAMGALRIGRLVQKTELQDSGFRSRRLSGRRLIGEGGRGRASYRPGMFDSDAQE